MSNDTPGQFSLIVSPSNLCKHEKTDVKAMMMMMMMNKVLYNLRHTLKFVRADDNSAIHRPNNVEAGKIVLNDIRWVIPEIKPSIGMRTELMEFLLYFLQIPSIQFAFRLMVLFLV